MREQIATALQAAGVGVGAAAGFSVSTTWGLAVLAVGLMAFGIAVERG